MVYFIRERTGSRRIKIGATEDVQKRLRQLQVGNSDQLIVLKVIYSEYSDSHYHHKFHPDWVRGEWFRPSADLLAFIKTIPESSFDGYTANYKQSDQTAEEPILTESTRLAALLKVTESLINIPEVQKAIADVLDAHPTFQADLCAAVGAS